MGPASDGGSQGGHLGSRPRRGRREEPPRSRCRQPRGITARAALAPPPPPPPPEPPPDLAVMAVMAALAAATAAAAAAGRLCRSPSIPHLSTSCQILRWLQEVTGGCDSSSIQLLDIDHPSHRYTIQIPNSQMRRSKLLCCATRELISMATWG